MIDVSMVVAGIDIGKGRLDVALHGTAGRMVFDNSAAGHRRMIQWLRAAQVVRVGLESTGSYSQGVTGALRDAGFEVAVLQPLQVRSFAKYRLQRAKSDPLDAALIATCTALLDKVHEAPDARLVPLADHLRLIEQLEEDVVRAKTRLEAAHLPHARRFLRLEIARLERREAAERALLMKSIAAEPDLLARLQLIQSVDGIGERTALSLLLLLPEQLGRADPGVPNRYFNPQRITGGQHDILGNDRQIGFLHVTDIGERHHDTIDQVGRVFRPYHPGQQQHGSG